MPSSSSMPPRPENASAVATAAAINPFHVLNSGSGSWGHTVTGAYARPPQATTLSLPPVRAIAGDGYPATLVVPANTMPSRTPYGELAPEMVQQLMFFARWRNSAPLFQNYGSIPPQGQPLLLPPPTGASYPIRAPSPFISGAPGSSGSSGGGLGAAAVQSSAVVAGTYGPGGSSKPPNVRPLQITAAATTAAGSTGKTKAPPSDGNADGAVEPLPPVLAMPTAAGAKGKQVAAGANGRVTRKRAPKDMDSSKAAAVSKNTRQQRVTGKQQTAGGKDTFAAVANQPGPRKSGPNTDTQSNDLQIVPVPPPPSNGRKRRPNAAAPPSSGSRCNLIARRGSGVAPAPVPAKKHTILTWLIDGGFVSDREKVFYVPGDGGAEKVVSGAVTQTGVHCSCCDAVVPLPVFEAHAGGRDDPAQQPWEKLMLVSGKSLLQCMQEAWEKERIKTFQSQEKLGAALEQEKEKNSLALRKFLAKQKKAILERIMSPRMTMMTGAKDSSDDACGVCADGGELLCCDSCTSTFHPECLAMKLSAQLSEMVGVMNPTEGGFSWALLKIQQDKPASSQDMSVILESNVKLAVALGVLNECFNPVKDRRTKIDMLHQAIYSLGSDFKRLSYEGFYTMVLEKDGEVISAALLRIHGTKVAEMPFAATLPAYRKQGMMRRLVDAVEQVGARNTVATSLLYMPETLTVHHSPIKLAVALTVGWFQVLASVQVEKLVIPAIADLVNTWERSFSFKPVDPEFREELKRLSLVVITGTTLLQKPVATAGAAPPQPPSSPRLQAAASPEQEEPWWLKYTVGAPPLTAEERAFLDMDTPFRGFTGLVTGNVSLQQALLRPGNSSSSSAAVRSMSPAAGSSRAGAQASSSGWRSCGESSAAMAALQLEPAGYAHGSSSSNGIGPRLAGYMHGKQALGNLHLMNGRSGNSI
ncbi:hypothetical protein U9M48_017528 [Paspalum notatum var. saurae]|uniref:N-acetyltransferase domain-containing protein n=1 Tax=Paspalum notatum var. saurae TaxID=547442 RepID=A0AAQ3WNQ9_PASNO